MIKFSVASRQLDEFLNKSLDETALMLLSGWKYITFVTFEAGWIDKAIVESGDNLLWGLKGV